MNILKITVKDDNSILLKIKATEDELLQLKGNVDNLGLFSADCISERAHIIKTGSRHNTSKYLLLPVSIRRNFKGYDYDNVKCGFIISEDETVHFIYSAKRK